MERTVTVGTGEGDRPGAEPGTITRESDDATLVRAASEGSRTAFDVIVERNQRQVYQVCYRFTGNHEDASDLAQETFVRAFRGLRNFRGQSALSTWLYRIAVNVCLNHRAKRGPVLDDLDVARHVDAGHTPADEQLDAAQRAARVRAAIGRLPARQRLTVILRVYHDLTHDQIAELLGSSVGTVKANFFHAVRNLRQQLRGTEATWRT